MKNPIPMADNDSNKDGANPAPELNVFSLIEKASEFQWMISVTTFALFVESALLIVKKKNFLTFSWKDVVLSDEVGHIIVGAIIFTICMSTIISVIEGIFNSLALQIELIMSPYIVQPSRSVPVGSVSTRQLRRRADEEQSDYLLSKCITAEELSKKNIKNSIKLGSRVFKFVVMLSTNLWISSESNSSSIHILTQFLGQDYYRMLICIVYMISAWICYKSWTVDYYPTVWVEYVPLYKEIEKKKKEPMPADWDLLWP
jgi:uncharacterized membrane protein (DUF485 family)